ncbi:MAG: helix-turn-helix domain-containing protein [Lutisporaceae bacterium]
MESWEKINAVQRMQDYVEQNINEPITLYNVAQVAGYSPWHSERIFKELIGKTLFEYIRAIRLSRAAIKLRDNQKLRIVDVAFDFIFDSHEGFTRAFSKQFGMTPHYYSKKTPPIRLFMPSRIRDYYLTIQKGETNMTQKSNTNTIFVQVVDRQARKLILKRGIKATHYYEYCDEVGCDVWGILTSVKEAIYEPIGLWLPKSLQKTDTSVYAQGVEVPANYTGVIPEGFDIIDLPACKMMVFQGQPYDDEKFEEAISEIWENMKKYDPKTYGFEWADEDAPRIQLEPMGYRGYIEARPVRQLNVK